jgi:hypothetical protein
MDNGKDTLAADPSAVFMLDTTIIQDGRFVEINSSAVDLLGENQFVAMEIVPA